MQDQKFTFEVSKQQLELVNSWRKDHEAQKHNNQPMYVGAIGGTYAWHFTSTGIGLLVSCHCACGEAIDVTDIDSF